MSFQYLYRIMEGVHKPQAIRVWPHSEILAGPVGPQKYLLGSLPTPGSLGLNAPKRLAASPPLLRLFLIRLLAFCGTNRAYCVLSKFFCFRVPNKSYHM